MSSEPWVDHGSSMTRVASFRPSSRSFSLFAMATSDSANGSEDVVSSSITIGDPILEVTVLSREYNYSTLRMRLIRCNAFVGRKHYDTELTAASPGDLLRDTLYTTRDMQRRATHADSWYEGNGQVLNRQLDEWLGAVETSDSFTPPIKGCKAIIGPHAGYSYSGPNAAWAYKSIDTTGIKRVFILGPSHHLYLRTCALSACESYATPLGSLPLDRETIDELEKTGAFDTMSKSTDEDEHSIEMHLPYVRKIFEDIDIKIVPVLVGSLETLQEASFGKLLAPYLSHEDTFTVVSSDFCHWGKRFSYTFYYPSPPPCEGVKLSKSTPRSVMAGLTSFPIHKSITALDDEAMDLLTLPCRNKDAGDASTVHAAFTEYLARTRNTICGRHPIGVLLGALSVINKEKEVALKWVKYDHSSDCVTLEDSSVSYASAYVTF